MDALGGDGGGDGGEIDGDAGIVVGLAMSEGEGELMWVVGCGVGRWLAVADHGGGGGVF